MVSTPPNKIALVTGGTGGLGRAVSLAFLRQDYKVAVTYRVPGEWEALESEAGDQKKNLEGNRLDVTEETAVSALMANLIEKHSRLDALVNTVGAYAGGIRPRFGSIGVRGVQGGRCGDGGCTRRRSQRYWRQSEFHSPEHHRHGGEPAS